MTEDTQAARDELHRLIATRALSFGDFVLTSGRRSTYYFDGKQVTLDGRGLFLVATLTLRRCRELGIDAVGGLTLGADPIAAAVAALSGATDRPLPAFIVRKQTKEHGTTRVIEGPSLRPGSRVLLVDDTLTTGGTFLAAREHVEREGAIVVEALCLVDREEGGREALEDAGIPVNALFRRSEFPAPDAAFESRGIRIPPRTPPTRFRLWRNESAFAERCRCSVVARLSPSRSHSPLESAITA